MASSLSQQWQQLHTRLAQQPRLRLGLWAVLLILALYLVLVVADHRQARTPELQRLADQHARLQQVLETADWTARADQARARRVALEGLLWRADSRGVARADFETWLRRSAGRHDLQRVRIEILGLDDLPEQPGLVRLRARIEASHDGAALTDFVAALAEADPPVQVQALVSSRARPARSRVDVQAIVRIGGEGGA